MSMAGDRKIWLHVLGFNPAHLHAHTVVTETICHNHQQLQNHSSHRSTLECEIMTLNMATACQLVTINWSVKFVAPSLVIVYYTCEDSVEVFLCAYERRKKGAWYGEREKWSCMWLCNPSVLIDILCASAFSTACRVHRPSSL